MPPIKANLTKETKVSPHAERIQGENLQSQTPAKIARSAKKRIPRTDGAPPGARNDRDPNEIRVKISVPEGSRPKDVTDFLSKQINTTLPEGLFLSKERSLVIIVKKDLGDLLIELKSLDLGEKGTIVFTGPPPPSFPLRMRVYVPIPQLQSTALDALTETMGPILKREEVVWTLNDKQQWGANVVVQSKSRKPPTLPDGSEWTGIIIVP